MSTTISNQNTPWRNEEKMRQLAEDYDSQSAIADELNTSRRTIGRWLREYNLEEIVKDRPWRNEDVLREAYLRLGTQQAVADEFETTSNTISYWMDKYGIEARVGKPDDPRYKPQELEELYIELGSIEAVSEELGGASPCSVLRWMRRHSIQTNRLHPDRGEKVEVECVTCGEEDEVYKCKVGNRRWFCSRDCMAEGYKVPSTPDRPYRGGWLSIRDEIREKSEVCQKCGVDTDRELDVHHIKPVRTFDNPSNAHTLDNLVALCRSCHHTLEHLPEEKQRKII